jgi:branched-chain amino acid transport system substrate-binding protein
MHPSYLASTKKPNDVKEPWDYYSIERTIPAEEAAQPLSQSKCPLVTQSH